MATIREILQKSFPTFFNRQARRNKHYVTMANSTTMFSVRDGDHSRNFSKIISNFFKRQARRKKHYVTIANSTLMSSMMRKAKESAVS